MAKTLGLEKNGKFWQKDAAHTVAMSLDAEVSLGIRHDADNITLAVLESGERVVRGESVEVEVCRGYFYLPGNKIGYNLDAAMTEAGIAMNDVPGRYRVHVERLPDAPVVEEAKPVTWPVVRRSREDGGYLRCGQCGNTIPPYTTPSECFLCGTRLSGEITQEQLAAVLRIYLDAQEVPHG